MKYPPEDTPVTRLEAEEFILVTLHVTGIAQSADCLARQADAEGFRGLAPEPVRRLLFDLEERGLVASQMEPLGNIRRWRITAKGSSVLKESGLDL
jgi:hypothetical protein